MHLSLQKYENTKKVNFSLIPEDQSSTCNYEYKWKPPALTICCHSIGLHHLN